MNFQIIPTNRFKKDVLELKKSYPYIFSDLKELNKILKANERAGMSLGNNLYKIRLKCSDIVKGKRSGYRVISYVVAEKQIIRLLTIYIKSKKVDIKKDEIIQLLKHEGII
jgi:mRNA-degrading endonuclease RelE of RelBE toxin-antitoxin system